MQASQRKSGGTPREREPVSEESSPIISLLEESDDESGVRTTGETMVIRAGGNIGQDVTTPGDSATTSGEEPLIQHSTSLIPSMTSSKSPDSPDKSSNDTVSCWYDKPAANVEQDLTCSHGASTPLKPQEDSYQDESSDPEYELITGMKFSSLKKASRLSSTKLLPSDASQSCHDTSRDVEADMQEKRFVAMNKRSEASGTRTDNSHDCEADIGQQTSQAQWSCQACTFLNHDSLPHCELCDTPRKRREKRQRVNTRSRVREKLKEKGTPNMKVETLSDSDEDFETSHYKSAASDRVTKSSSYRSKDVITVEDNALKDISLSHDSPSVGLKCGKLEKRQTPSVNHSRSPMPSHGIEISDSDSDSVEDGTFKVEPLAMDQSTPVGRRSKEEQKYRHPIRESYSPSGSKGQRADVIKPKTHRAEVQSKGLPPGRGGGEISSSESKKNGSAVDLGEDLFSDEEGAISDETRLGKHGKRVSELNIKREPESTVSSCPSSSSDFKPKVKSWTCMEPSCRHVNPPSEVECENCWASKPIQEMRSGGSTLRNSNGSDCGLLPGFVAASEVLRTGGQSQVKSTPSKVGLLHAEAASSGGGDRNRLQSGEKQRGDAGMKLEAESVKGDEICEEESGRIVVFEAFLYCASKFTDRIYLYDSVSMSL